MKHQLAQALQMERQRLRYEAIGMIRARAIAIRARGAALRMWLKTGSAHAVQTAVGVHLSPLISVVTDGMVAGHLAGVLRTQERVVERGKGQRGIRLSSAYENALRFLRERTGMTQEQQESLQTRYDTAATQVVVGATRQAQDKIANAIQESIEAGDSVKRGATKVAAAFEAAGLGAQKKHTLEQVFRTQTQLAYSAGRMNSLADPAVQEILWGFEYVTVGDARVRPSHKEMDGHKAPKDDPIWSRWTPPNGYNCRCAILEIFDKGIANEKTPDVQPDKGFAFNPGDLTEGVAEESLPLKPTSTNPAAPDPTLPGKKEEPRDYRREQEQWYGTMTDDEAAAIKAWEADFDTNRAIQQLASGKPYTVTNVPIEKARKWADDFKRKVANAPRFEGTVYRGLEDPDPERLAPLLKEGETVEMDSFSSSSKVKDVAMGYAVGETMTNPVVLKIRTSSGVELSKSTHHSGTEVILRPDAKYKVKSVQNKTHFDEDLEEKISYREIELEEVLPPVPGEKPTAKQVAPAVPVDDTKLTEPVKPEDKPKQSAATAPDPRTYASTQLVRGDVDFGRMDESQIRAFNEGVESVMLANPEMGKLSRVYVNDDDPALMRGGTGGISINSKEVQKLVAIDGPKETASLLETRATSLRVLDERIGELETKIATLKGAEKKKVLADLADQRKIRDEWENTRRGFVMDEVSGVDRVKLAAMHESGHVLEAMGGIQDAFRDALFDEKATDPKLWQQLSNYCISSSSMNENRGELFAEITAAVQSGRSHIVPAPLLRAYNTAISQAKNILGKPA